MKLAGLSFLILLAGCQNFTHIERNPKVLDIPDLALQLADYRDTLSEQDRWTVNLRLSGNGEVLLAVLKNQCWTIDIHSRTVKSSFTWNKLIDCASISHDGQRVVIGHSDEGNYSSVAIWDAGKGKVVYDGIVLAFF